LDVYHFALLNFDAESYQGMGVDVLYRMIGISSPNAGVGQPSLRLLSERTGKLVCDLPTAWYYPLEPNSIQDVRVLRDDIYGFHWYGGVGHQNRMTTHMTPDNWMDFNGGVVLALERYFRGNDG